MLLSLVPPPSRDRDTMLSCLPLSLLSNLSHDDKYHTYQKNALALIPLCFPCYIFSAFSFSLFFLFRDMFGIPVDETRGGLSTSFDRPFLF